MFVNCKKLCVLIAIGIALKKALRQAQGDNLQLYLFATIEPSDSNRVYSLYLKNSFYQNLYDLYGKKSIN